LGGEIGQNLEETFFGEIRLSEVDVDLDLDAHDKYIKESWSQM